jgi:hypothetical protein
VVEAGWLRPRVFVFTWEIEFMRRFASIAAALLLGLGLANVSQAELIAYWNFNSNNLPGGGFGYQPGDFPLALIREPEPVY